MVLSFGFGLAVLVIDGFFLIHTMIYGTHKQTHNKEKEIKVLSSSSNRKKLRYGDGSNIFGWFSNGMAEIKLEMMWLSFWANGGFLAHEMMSRRSGLGAK